VADAHRAVKKITEDIDSFHFNTAIPPLMTVTNDLVDQARSGIPRQAFVEVTEILMKMLSPMAPHIAHELWELTGHETLLALESWPAWDPKLVERSQVTMVVQVNGKLRDRIEVDSDIAASEAERLAVSAEKVQQWIDGQEIRKVIVREPNLVNIVVG
ncbi:MAG: class I tRNA ligase family protein, partial [Acidimicrobiia bacterium]